jgi:hypothetical protein
MTRAPLPVILHRSPFTLDVQQNLAVEGQSIADILGDFPGLPPEIWSHGVVHVGEWEIPREHWKRVKPKAGSRHIIRVSVRMAEGGREGGGKNPLAMIAAIALVVVTTAISGGLLGPAGLGLSSTLFAAGSVSAALLATGVAAVGALAINALAPPPTQSSPSAAKEQKQKKGSLGSASIQANVLGAYDPIPFVMGTHRISPPHLIVPWSESINDDQFVYAIVGLNGAHAFEDIQINGTPIDDFADVEYEVRDVVNDDSNITLIPKQVFENQVSAEITGHKVRDDDTDTLQSATSVPEWISARSLSEPDEIWLTIAWTAMLMQGTSEVERGGMGMRLRIRRVGDVAWINLPEFHAQRERIDPFRAMIKLRFQPMPDSAVRLDQTLVSPPWRYAIYATDAVNDEDFDTHSYFAPSTGNNAENVSAENGTAVVYLDPDVFPPGTYDVQIMRGYGYRVLDFASSSYRLSSQIPYFYTMTPGGLTIRQDQAKTPSRATWAAMSSVWNEYPLGEKGISLLAIKAKNVAISALSVRARGYANIWNGADWNTFALTSNPAAWLRYLALGGQSIKAPFVEAQLDNAGLADWYDYNDEKSFACNALMEGSQSVGEVIRLIAGTGRAALRVSDKIGVVIDRSRADESPIQLFTQRNTRGLTIRRAFPRIPDGLRVRFNDETADYSAREIFVYRRQLDGDPRDLEAVTYVGVTSEAHAVNRAQLDLKQLLRRGTLYNFETDVSNLYCVKGSLVALSHDTVRRHYDSARVEDVVLSGTLVTGLLLDSTLRLSLAARTTDFEDDALAAPPSGWTSQWEATVTALVTAQANLPAGKGPLVDKGGAPADSFLAWADAGTDAGADCELLALIRPDADGGTTDNRFGVALRASGGLGARTGYLALFQSSTPGARDRLRIGKLVAGVYTQLADVAFSWVTGASYLLRFRARDVALKAKAWIDGTPEPDVWTLTAADPTISGAGLMGVYVYHPSTAFYVGEFMAAPISGLVTQLKDGSTRIDELNETSDTDEVSFAEPFSILPDEILSADCLVACGPFSSTLKRMLVLGIQPQDEFTASITLVDEAPSVRLRWSDRSRITLNGGTEQAVTAF